MTTTRNRAFVAFQKTDCREAKHFSVSVGSFEKPELIGSQTLEGSEREFMSGLQAPFDYFNERVIENRNKVKGQVQIGLKLTADTAQKTRNAEKEHLQDFEHAYKISLKVVADKINALSGKEYMRKIVKHKENVAVRGTQARALKALINPLLSEHPRLVSTEIANFTDEEVIERPDYVIEKLNVHWKALVSALNDLSLRRDLPDRRGNHKFEYKAKAFRYKPPSAFAGCVYIEPTTDGTNFIIKNNSEEIVNLDSLSNL